MSEIKFSNLIFEEQKEVLAQLFTTQKFDLKNPKPVSNTNPNPILDYSNIISLSKNKDKEYYVNKINTSGVNLDLLKQEILTQPLLDLVKSNLIDMIEQKKVYPQKIVKYKDKFFELNPTTKAGFGVSGSGGTAGLGNTSGQTLIIDTDAASDVDPLTLKQIELDSLYAGGIEKDPSISIRGMKPSTESIGMEQTQTLASLEGQYKETLKKINLLDKVYSELVRNPTNLNLGSILNAHSNSKFVKLAETEVKEADEVTEEYYDDLLPGFGTALEHPEKYRNIPTDEIKPHKAPKFIRVK